jgi:hypothetical protein
MAKKGPIGKVEGFYIENNYPQIDVSQLASDLDRPKSSVENYIKKNVKSKKPNTVTVGDQLARRPGVVTMTENASSMSDSIRKNKSTSKVRGCTVKIRNDE